MFLVWVTAPHQELPFLLQALAPIHKSRRCRARLTGLQNRTLRTARDLEGAAISPPAPSSVPPALTYAPASASSPVMLDIITPMSSEAQMLGARISDRINHLEATCPGRKSPDILFCVHPATLWVFHKMFIWLVSVSPETEECSTPVHQSNWVLAPLVNFISRVGDGIFSHSKSKISRVVFIIDEGPIISSWICPICLNVLKIRNGISEVSLLT